MLKGKIALISGGSRGIGQAIALEFAKQGADIAVLYSSSAEGAEYTCRAAQNIGVRAFCYACDVSSAQDCQDTVKQINADLGPISILVNNAGITRDKLALQMSPDDFEAVLSVNLNGAFNLIHYTYAGFMRQRYGRIINITSVAGVHGNAGQANYAASKAGLIGLTKSIAKELAGRGVTCNAIAPGLIESDMTNAMPEAAKAGLLATIPAKRAGKAAEVADLAAFLASDSASYITGAVIPIDGGLGM